jgi:GTP cyclohydrolase II
MLKKQENISKAHLAAGRTVDQLRRQLGIVLHEDSGGRSGACPIEGLTGQLYAQLHALPEVRLFLLLTATRARTLGLQTGEAPNVCIEAQRLTLPMLQALADPLATPAEMPDMRVHPAHPAQDMAMKMAKHASLLPALLLVEASVFPEEWLQVAVADVTAYWNETPLDIVPLVQAALPIEGAEGAKIICLRERYGTSVHLALLFGDTARDDAPLTRIHSSCLTGDILGSLRCDCGDQLKLALVELGAAPSGILLYLHQEGRGIGIANKLRAYALQERGHDTYEANLQLGFAEDERDFSLAATILKNIGIKRIRLLTNNPHKLAAVEKAGITVTQRVPLVVKSGRHNHDYLAAKAKKSGHVF